jgi:transcriptional regulator NrdR family protein
MKTETGGTAMYCPKCEKITSCKGVSPREINRGLQSGQRFYQRAHTDLHFFRRGRICQVCDHRFISAETRESFIDELVELRDALAVIKHDTEEYVLASKKTSRSLRGLTKSLAKLRALKAYQLQK